MKKWTFETFLKSHGVLILIKNIINFLNERYLI